MPDTLILEGCRPIPLAGYLKALGVLRLVAEQADPTVRGWWEGDRFRLKSALDRDELRRFFLEDYRPTPIIAPWNGGSGFYLKDAKGGISALEGSAHPRFDAYRAAIHHGTQLIRARKLDERPTDHAKSALIAELRAEGEPELVAWIDAAVALTLDRTAFPPLLGTGGNDGRLDFTNNFMQRLTEVLPVGGDIPPRSGPALDSSLFARPVTGLASAAVGQFAPGAAGGPNSASGFEGPARVNAWDFVLMLEGALVFAGSVSRRLEGADAAFLSYPFTVRAAGAGFGSASLEEQADARGELWAPLWERPAAYAELRALFREGRLSVGARPARDGLDAARAAGGLAADRRIAAFERFGFVKRQGLAYLAAPLGRRGVRPNPTGELLSDLDRGRWLESLRRVAVSENSAGLRGAVRALEEGAFALLERPDDRRAVQTVLIAVGRAARVIADRPRLQEAIRPPPGLSSKWIEVADDRTIEFRLAVALAGLRAPTAQTPPNADGSAESIGPGSPHRYSLPLRAHLGPLDPSARPGQPRWSAEAGGPLAVWGAGPLVDNLGAVARRRLLEHTRRTLAEVPFDGIFGTGVDSGEIAAFLDGSVRDGGIADLALGLAWASLAAWTGKRRSASLPFAYAAIKPLFTPRSVLDRLDGVLPELPIPPALPALLASGRVQDAVRLAQERARASGLPTPFLDPRGRGRERPADLASGRRLLAALVIPVRVGVVRACLDQAYSFADQES